jgi:uncharacterized protein (DUF983 family)
MRPVTREQCRAIGRLRCPRCLEGAVYNGMISMHANCPVCGLLYYREQGFFLGALYIAYGLGVPLLFAAMILTSRALHRSIFDSFWHSLVLFIPITPWIFRYSRVIWMHAIQHLDPIDKHHRNSACG